MINQSEFGDQDIEQDSCQAQPEKPICEIQLTLTTLAARVWIPDSHSEYPEGLDSTPTFQLCLVYASQRTIPRRLSPRYECIVGVPNDTH